MEKILLSLGLPKDVVHVIKDMALADFRARVDAFGALYESVAVTWNLFRYKEGRGKVFEQAATIDPQLDLQFRLCFLWLGGYIESFENKLACTGRAYETVIGKDGIVEWYGRLKSAGHI